MRPDLSRIHWFKRLTLIVLGFSVSSSIVVAIGLQFYWIGIYCELAPWTVIAETDRRTLTIEAAQRGTTVFGISHIVSEFPVPDSSGWNSYPFSQPWGPPVCIRYVSLPGIKLTRTSADSDWPETWLLTIHHASPICLTAALYLFARYRIQRSARKQSLALPASSDV